MATKKATAPKPAELQLLASGQFQTRDAVRAFVAGSDFEALAELVGVGLLPEREGVSSVLVGEARDGAAALLPDLVTLARLAAQDGGEPFTPPLASRWHYFSQRAAWLGAMHAAMEGVELEGDAIARAIERQHAELQDEEGEAWRAKRSARSRAKREAA